MANYSKLVGQLPKNDVSLTQCYKMVQKEDVVSMRHKLWDVTSDVSTGRAWEGAESESGAVSHHLRPSVQADVVHRVRRSSARQSHDVRRWDGTSQNQEQFPRRKVSLYLSLYFRWPSMISKPDFSAHISETIQDRHLVTTARRLTESDMWSIELHHRQEPWWTFK